MKCTNGFENKCRGANPSGDCHCACGGNNHGLDYSDEPVYEEELPDNFLLDGDSIKGDAESRRVFVGLNELYPEKSRQLYDHSPDGFAWGYGGSGASQLSLAILIELIGIDEVAGNLYMDFKWDIISKLPHGQDFILPIETVENWLKAKNVII